MIEHIISDDEYSHIQSETCWCNPRISQSEGITYYIHNSNYDINNNKNIDEYEVESNKGN